LTLTALILSILAIVFNPFVIYLFSITTLAIISIPLIIYFIPLILAIFAVVFGIIGLTRISSNPDKYRGKGVGATAIVLGVLALIIALIVLAIINLTILIII
jgi:hypothetical protein